jgi:hypothetical protein
MKNILLAICIGAVIFSCSDNASSDDSLIFNIDSAKIGKLETLADFNITFHPPKNWDEVEASISERIVNSLKSQKNGDSKYIYQPVKIFLNKTNNSLLAVGKVASQDSIEKSNKLKEYLQVVSENFNESINKKGAFTKDGIEITQFLLQKQTLISFKLIFDLDDTIYQFDYTTQKETYQDELKSIESSMGTIKPITN